MRLDIAMRSMRREQFCVRNVGFDAAEIHQVGADAVQRVGDTTIPIDIMIRPDLLTVELLSAGVQIG
ncbi:hypothetical protein N7476_004942 [Penicillium atrosanguineum]|uniref:Uncharacterized protein n=1 Tax=Penicillium atrosanguineum TaxID=1132637 RepID=A0A9W9U760_9EURO|nr:hypothetical protein N7526_011430 [Penicillium atrosanguineum]KAJ5318522.1 hypothetical protein N7476_004942 [Penicillium atrosanguineum]